MLRPEFKRLYDDYAPRGVKFVLLVGQTSPGVPATAAEAQQYKVSKGYQDGWIALSDPNFEKTEEVILATSSAIPQHIVMDQELVLRFASSSGDFVYSPETKLLQILAAQGKL